MRVRIFTVAAIALPIGALAIGAGGLWLGASPAPEPMPEAYSETLPAPPFPPRIAQGERYEQCLAQLIDDPSGALAAAEAWLAEAGGDGALHCRALALIADGKSDIGVAQLERLGQIGDAPELGRAAILGQAAQVRLMAGQAQPALEDATLALALAPGDGDLLVMRAMAAAALDRPEAAIQDLTRALTLHAHRRDALVLRAAIWRRQNRLDLAAADMERAIELDPDDPEALLERGILRQLQGDREGARADWLHAKALDPDGTVGDLADQNLALLDAGPNQR